MGKARKTKLKEYKAPRTSHYIVVANPLPIGTGPSDARFHDGLGSWLEWLTGKKAMSIYYMSTMSSVVVELPGQMTDEVAERLLGEHEMRNPRTGERWGSQVYEYDYKRFGCPDEVQRCSRGSYSIAAPQRLELPRPRECAFNPNVRFAKPNPPRRAQQPPAEANPSPPDHHYQRQLDPVPEQPVIIKRDPYEEDDNDRHQLQLQLESTRATTPPRPPTESERHPEVPTTASRWQPYETPLENRARVGSRAPEHDVFSSRVQQRISDAADSSIRVKPEPMDVDLPPPRAHQYGEDEEPEPRDDSPEVGSAEYYRRALEQAEREVTENGRSSFKEEPQDEQQHVIVKREPREETVPLEDIRPKQEEEHRREPLIKQEPSIDSIPTPPAVHNHKPERMRSTTLASERQLSVKQEPSIDTIPARPAFHNHKPERMRSTTLVSERQPSVKQEPTWDSPPPPPSHAHRQSMKEEPPTSSYVKSEPLARLPVDNYLRLPPPTAPSRMRHPPQLSAHYHAPDHKPPRPIIKREPPPTSSRTRYSPGRDPRRSATLASDVIKSEDHNGRPRFSYTHHDRQDHHPNRPGNEKKRGHEFTGRDGAGKRVKTEYEEY